MFKSSRWRSEKNKIKAVFKLQFHATQVLLCFWELNLVKDSIFIYSLFLKISVECIGNDNVKFSVSCTFFLDS